jgi:hypothetical protein
MACFEAICSYIVYLSTFALRGGAPIRHVPVRHIPISCGVAGACNQRWLQPMNPGGTDASLGAGERNRLFLQLIEQRIPRLAAQSPACSPGIAVDTSSARRGKVLEPAPERFEADRKRSMLGGAKVGAGMCRCASGPLLDQADCGANPLRSSSCRGPCRPRARRRRATGSAVRSAECAHRRWRSCGNPSAPSLDPMRIRR